MAYAKWTNDSLNKMIFQFEGMKDIGREESAKLVEESINEGAAIMRTNIETSGRIDQGYMLGDVAASEVQSDAKGVRGQFGWGVTSGPVQDYYLHQENGFKHWRSGKNIPPMHALLEAFITVSQKFEEKFLEMIK